MKVSTSLVTGFSSCLLSVFNQVLIIMKHCSLSSYRHLGILYLFFVEINHYRRMSICYTENYKAEPRVALL